MSTRHIVGVVILKMIMVVIEMASVVERYGAAMETDRQRDTEKKEKRKAKRTVVATAENPSGGQYNHRLTTIGVEDGVLKEK